MFAKADSMANLPDDLLLAICKVSPAAGQALHLADPRLRGYSTPEQRMRWYHVKDRRGRTWIQTKQALLLHNYKDPEDPLLTIIRSPIPLRWCKFGKLHRGGDKPAIITADVRMWYRHGVVYRSDKPALISSDMISWYKDGDYHREGNYPASVFTEGNRWIYEYFQQGKIYPGYIDGNGGAHHGVSCLGPRHPAYSEFVACNQCIVHW